MATDDKVKWMLTGAAVGAAGALAVSTLLYRKRLQEMEKYAVYGGKGYDHDAALIESGKDQMTLTGCISKLAHVALIVKDAKRSFEFYSKFFGLKQLHRPNFPSPGYWLWMGNVQLHLIQQDYADVEASHSSKAALGNVNHYAFDAHDFDEIERRLKLADASGELAKIGVSFGKNVCMDSASRTMIGQLFIKDPDGHYLEICQCRKMDDFIHHGEEADDKAAGLLASKYEEGYEVPSGIIAVALGMGWRECAGCHSEKDLEARVDGLRKCFETLAGKDGLLNLDEFERLLRRMGIKAYADFETNPATRKQLQAVIDKHDISGDGQIGFKEFARFVLATLGANESELDYRQAFHVVDRDGDGAISIDEMRLIMWGSGHRMNEKQIDECFKAGDKNRDGKITLEEFEGILKRGQFYKTLRTSSLHEDSRT